MPINRLEYEVRYTHSYMQWPNTTIVRRSLDGAFLLFRKEKVGAKQKLIMPSDYSDYATVLRAWDCASKIPREGDYTAVPVINGFKH